MLTTEAQSHRESEDNKDSRTSSIIGAALEVQRHLGPSLLESTHEECLCHKLRLRGIDFRRQIELPVEYKGLKLDCGYRLNLVVHDEVVVELKCVERVLPVHEAQLFTYMMLTGKRVGLLINFNVPLLTKDISRRVL
jgi:GxxExxY protein